MNAGVADGKRGLFRRRTEDRKVIGSEGTILVIPRHRQDAEVLARVLERRHHGGDILLVVDQGIAKGRMTLHVGDLDRHADRQAIAQDPLTRGDAGQADVTLKCPRIALRLAEDFVGNAHQGRAILREVGRRQVLVIGRHEVNRPAPRMDHFTDSLDDDA